jgi:glucan biosynthesis protein C
VIESNRLHYLDNLRALAMLAGVLFHAALAYSPLVHPLWLTADRSHSSWVDVVAWFVHLFRMPLFFAIAGFFAARLVQQRGVSGMLRNRVARVLLPLLVFWPLVVAAIGWLAGQAASHVRHTPPLIEWMRRSPLPSLPLSLAHLWFLSYLLIFYLFIWIAATAEWKLPARWARAATPATLLGFAPLLLVPSLASVAAPSPAPDGLFPQLWAVVYYGAFFSFGYALHARPSLLALPRSSAAALGLAALAAHGGLLWLLERPGPPPLTALLQAYGSVWMTVSCLRAGQAWLDAPLAGLRHLADASYWTYLVHLPVVFAVQLPLLDWDAGWPVKWAISVFTTLALCLATYPLAVRTPILGRILNGEPERRKAERRKG